MSMHHTTGYSEAEQTVERKIRFLIHLGVYMIVNAALYIAGQAGARNHALPYAPMLFWGLALAVHGLKVYLRVPGARLKQRMIEQELRKQQA